MGDAVAVCALIQNAHTFIFETNAAINSRSPIDKQRVRGSSRFSRLQTELDDLPTALRWDPFLVPPKVARYVKLNDLRHFLPPLRPHLTTAHDPAIPSRTDNGQNRKAVTFARAFCRLHMNASTCFVPLTYWTRQIRIATQLLCHLIVKIVST